jgi:hypothetical protein
MMRQNVKVLCQSDRCDLEEYSEENFHILTHHSIIIYRFCQKEEKSLLFCCCYANFLRQDLSSECLRLGLSYNTQIKRHQVISRKKIHNKKILGRLKTCGVIFFFSEG